MSGRTATQFVKKLRFPDLRPVPARPRPGDLDGRCMQVRLLSLLEYSGRGMSVLFCHRAKDHTDRHHSGDGTHIVAVWEDEQ